MDPNTLPFYFSASVLNAILGVLLVGFSRFQSDSMGAKVTSIALFCLAAAFFVAGLGPQLPLWMTVIGTNMAIASAGVIFHTGLAAVISKQPAALDRFGWAVVALTLLPFWYWGLVEPDGRYRSIVFSFAIFAINVRTATLLFRAARKQPDDIPAWFLTILLSILCLWMLARGLWLLIDPPLVAQRAANPTSWITVFAYMVLITLTTTAILWMEHGQPLPSQYRKLPLKETGKDKKLAILWGIVILFILVTGIGLYQYYQRVHDEEAERSLREAQIANDAFVEHTARIVNQVDTLLLAVRGYYQMTRSIEATERHIESLGIDHSLMESIWLIDAGGEIFLPRKDRSQGPFALTRDYFVFHSNNTEDQLYIGSVLRGQVSGKFQFRLSRRLNNPDGSFAGVILIPVEPRAFAEFYERLIHGADNIATLAGIQDRKIRARHPLPIPDSFDRPLDATPLWNALSEASTGSYQNQSSIDGTERQFVYKQVGKLPLVMVTAYSAADVQTRVVEKIRLIALAALSAAGLVVMLALILTLALRNQKSLTKLLVNLNEANEQHQALFNATHEGVILLDGDYPVDCNPAILSMFGIPSKEAFLVLPPWSPRITPALQPDGSTTEAYARRQIETALRNGTHRFDYVHKRFDTGAEFPAEIMLTATHIANRPLLQAVIRDISERIDYERALEMHNTELSRRNDEQDRFLSMLSHELKTPLAVIRMSLLNDSPESRQRVERNITDINAIVERCLQTDRLQHDRIAVAAARCDLQALIDKSIADSQDPQRIMLTSHAPLPACETDQQLLGIILANLLDNALKYGAANSPVAIEISFQESDGRPGMRIDVTNTAGTAGLPDPEQVFSKYYRAPGAHAKTGSGLGLHLAAGFAHKLGGQLLYAPQGDTVKFVLWIPLRLAP